MTLLGLMSFQTFGAKFEHQNAQSQNKGQGIGQD
jgi:hypothetical protein